MPSLFVIQGRDQGRRFELTSPIVTVGRDTTNTIQVRDTEVSRRHAELRREEDAYALVDLSSSNGCYVNSQRVARQRLRSGDRLQVGGTLMIFTGAGDTSSAQLVDGVNIVGNTGVTENSRIVKSISQEEGSRIFGPVQSSESPWLARARSNLQVMYRTALAVSHTLDIDQLLGRIMDLIFEWVEADRGCAMLVEMGGGDLVPKVRRNRRGVKVGNRMSISGTILEYVMEHQEGVLTSDAKEDQRWDPAGSIVKMGVREAICVPMQGRYGIVGVIYVDTFTPPGLMIQQGGANRFTEEHLKLMVAIGHQAALAVEDTSYYSAMVQAERLAAVGQTIAGLSHHIKNILQGIRGGSYLIEEGLKADDPDLVRKGWGFVEKNQEKISNLVMDMLTYSKERQPDLASTDLNEVVADVVELMKPHAELENVQLVAQTDDDMPALMFDPEGMHRAILNVVTNAIDACAEEDDGRVAVSTAYDADRGRIHAVVEDNGMGIPSDKLKRVFDVFESGKGSRGTGLGLAVSQKILREHGGEIKIASKIGQGSRFTLELPAVPPDAKLTQPIAGNADAPTEREV